MRKEWCKDVYLEELITITYLKMTFNFVRKKKSQQKAKEVTRKMSKSVYFFLTYGMEQVIGPSLKPFEPRIVIKYF